MNSATVPKRRVNKEKIPSRSVSPSMNFLFDFFDFRKKFPDFHFQCGCDFNEIQGGYIPLTALDSAIISPIQSGKMSHFVLRKSFTFTVRTDFSPDRK